MQFLFVSNSNVQRNWSWICYCLCCCFGWNGYQSQQENELKARAYFGAKKKVYKIYTSVSIVANTSGASALLTLPHFLFVACIFRFHRSIAEMFFGFDCLYLVGLKGGPFMLASILFGGWCIFILVTLSLLLMLFFPLYTELLLFFCLFLGRLNPNIHA